VRWIQTAVWGLVMIGCVSVLGRLWPAVFSFETLAVAMPLHVAGVMIGSADIRSFLFFFAVLALLGVPTYVSAHFAHFVGHLPTAVAVLWCAAFIAGLMLGRRCRRVESVSTLRDGPAE
jgi:hypothetical protein